MKTKTLSVLLALGGSFFITTPAAEAAVCRSDLMREVQNLSRLATRLESEYHAELREQGRACGERAALMESLCAMQNSADLLRRSVENGEPSCNQERLFGMVRGRYCQVQERASRVRVCTCVRGLISDVGRSIRTLDAMGFRLAHSQPSGYESPHHGHGRPHGSSKPFSRPPHPREILLGGLLGVFGGR